MSRRREAQELAQALALSATSSSPFEPIVEVPLMPRTSPRQSSQRTPPGRRASAQSQDADAASPGSRSNRTQRHDVNASDAHRPARDTDSMAIQGDVLSDGPSREMHAKGSKRKSSPGGDRRRKGRRYDEKEYENAQDESDENVGGQETENTPVAPEAEANADDGKQRRQDHGGADGESGYAEQEGVAGTYETPADDEPVPAPADTHPGSSHSPSKDAQATPDRREPSFEAKKRLYGKPLSQLLRGGRAQSPSEQAGGSPGSLRATGLQRTARVPPLHVKRRSPPPPRPKIPKKEDKKPEKEDESAEENDGEQARGDYPFVDYDVEEGFL